MRYKKNVKRIDPRYFLEETANRGEEDLEEARGGPLPAGARALPPSAGEPGPEAIEGPPEPALQQLETPEERAARARAHAGERDIIIATGQEEEYLRSVEREENVDTPSGELPPEDDPGRIKIYKKRPSINIEEDPPKAPLEYPPEEEPPEEERPRSRSRTISRGIE